MGIYISSVLRSRPIKLSLMEDGQIKEVSVYRIKFHGKEVWRWSQGFQGCSSFKEVEDRAQRSWAGFTAPLYGIQTCDYGGKIDTNNEYEVVMIKPGYFAWRETDGIWRCIGRVVKQGRGTYKFKPNVDKILTDIKTVSREVGL